MDQTNESCDRNETTEEAIQRKGLAALRITPERIEAVIDPAIVTGYHVFPGTTVTVCCISLNNGYAVVGEAACASLENFDEELGRRIAYDNAKQKIWPLEGYLLRQRITEETPPPVTA